MPKIVQHIRGRKGPYALQNWDRLGSILIASEDPEGEDIPKEAFDAIILPSDRHLIHGDHWNAWLNLCIHMLGKVDSKVRSPDSGQEVSCAFMLPPGKKHLEIWIQTQRTGGASVDIDYTKPLRNILTGEEYPNLASMEDAGYIKMGGCHSHNTIGAFFSGTDDKNEKPQPGYHFVVGAFEQKEGSWFYRHALSITANNRRFEKYMLLDGTLQAFDLKDFVLPLQEGDPTFHEGVMELIDWRKPIVHHSSRADWGDRHSLGFYTGVHEDGSLCEERTCWGRVQKDGICNECGVYNREMDKRPTGIINLELAFQPYYDRDGDLVGYIYPGKKGAVAIGPRDLPRLQAMHKWDKNGKPTETLSGRYIDNTIEQMVEDSRHTPDVGRERVIVWNQRAKDTVHREAQELVGIMDLAGIEAKASDLVGAMNMLMRIRDWAMEVDSSPNKELLQIIGSIFDDAIDMATWLDRKEER